MSEYPERPLDEVTLVELLHAAGDPARLAILRVLADGKPHAKTVEVWGLDLQKSTLSHHFKTLREAGFTRTIVDGRHHSLQLRRSELDERFPGLLDAILR